MLLPVGVLLISFGLMLLLGSTLQTISGALNLFKRMAIGLGGGLYLMVPLMIIWLGVLLVISAKRYVSIYAFLICLLLMMCIGALMTLTLKVNDQSYPRLMDYIKNLNSLRGAAYPDSLGEYLHAAYNRYSGLRSDNGFYPGGGVLSMLLAYPLYITLGNIGAVAILIILVIALGFALLRVSPVRLIQQFSDKTNRIPAANPQITSQAQVQGSTASIQNSDQNYPEEIYPPAFEQEIESPVQWPVQKDETNHAFQQASWTDADIYQDNQHSSIAKPMQQGIEPGFIPQTGDQLFEEFPQPVFQPSVKQSSTSKPQPYNGTHSSTVREQFAPATEQPLPAAQLVQKRTEHIKTRSVFDDNINEAANDKATGSEYQPVSTPRSRRNQQVSDAGNQDAKLDAAAVEHLADKPQFAEQARKTEPAANQVHTAPAVPLTGERIPIQKRNETVRKDTMDGMARTPAATQIRLALDDYGMPPLRLLTAGPKEEQDDTTEEDRIRAEKLIETLRNFSITAHLHDIVHGPTVTRFAIRLAEGVNVSKLRNVMDNLTIELKAKGEIRAEMPIPGTSFVGLEVSNDKTSKVFLRDVLESSRMTENRSPTAVALGKDITGTPIVCELMDMPHLLIAGATGSGKSVCINSIICSILYRASPRHVRLIMVDPKFVELQPYNDVPHLMMPVITDAKKATAALDWVCQEMDQRYQILVEAGVRNLDAYNKKLGPDEDPLPRIIVIVDEMADLMTTSGKMIEDHIKRITAKARAAGICLIMATQRPSVNIITGVIKANIPGRIAFRVSSPFDSKTILDSQGAEKLLGYGDMLYRSQTREPVRVQGSFVSDHDVEQTVEYIRSRNKAEYILDLIEHVEQSDQGENGNGAGESLEGGDAEFDELLPQAIEMAVEAGQMSISMLQRVLRVGYARSGRLIDEMARRGIISGNEGTKARKTLMSREQYLNYLEQGK